MAEREIDVYWTYRRGRPWSVCLSEAEARDSIRSIAGSKQNAGNWTVVRTRESVPVASGEVLKGGGEALTLADQVSDVSREFYSALHVFWQCPLCNQPHSCSLYDGRLARARTATSPAVWFCEQGEGIVLVQWKADASSEPATEGVPDGS